ncbi:hypothetical protein [Rhizobium sp. BK176]|uniref:hypothetical protein n=1 Tax=Rhizobium sp. BK176 TaxID=2587071 RepID=UPI00216816A3|nr:hypothetical protein [Rhizobium sp. BK176]MCS4088635.1 hypothetical protein [Rhizobium sp. BK176]
MNENNSGRRTHLNGSVITLVWKPSDARRYTVEAETPFGTYWVMDVDGDDTIWSAPGSATRSLIKGGAGAGKAACQVDFANKIASCIGPDAHPRPDANAEFWKNDAVDKAANIASVYGEEHVAEEIRRLKTSTFSA